MSSCTPARLGAGDFRPAGTVDWVLDRARTADWGAAELAGGREFLVASDARRKELYWARYSAFGQRVTGPEVSPASDLPAGLPVAGEGPALYPELGACPIPPRYPDAAHLAQIAARSLAEHPVPGLPEPLYLRQPDAREPGQPKRKELQRPGRRQRILGRPASVLVDRGDKRLCQADNPDGSGDRGAQDGPDRPGLTPRVTLVGYSMGGLVVRLWAFRHPGVVMHLVELASPDAGTDAATNFFAIFLSRCASGALHDLTPFFVSDFNNRVDLSHYWDPDPASTHITTVAAVPPTGEHPDGSVPEGLSFIHI